MMTMVFADKKDSLRTRAKAVADQVSTGVDELKTAAAAVRTSTDALVVTMAVMALLTCVTLVLVVNVNRNTRPLL